MIRESVVTFAIVATLVLTSCSARENVRTQEQARGQTTTPEQARDQTMDVLNGTITASGATDWVLDGDGSAIPQQCNADGEGGVTFGHGGYATAPGGDPAADAQRVADYWTSIGIETRVVSDPTPTVFGRGGPVNAISFGTAPGYTISLGGVCVPGDPFDYYDDIPTPAPTEAP